MHACMYVCMNIRTCILIAGTAPVCVCVCLCARVRVCVCVFKYIHLLGADGAYMVSWHA